MSKVFALQLNLKIRKINIRAQKIENITLEINEMVVFTFFIIDKNDKVKFFEKNFLFGNVKLDVIFGMLFLTISNIDINFIAQNL